MATKQLTKAQTEIWLSHHAADAQFDYMQRRGGFTVRATKFGAQPNSIWLDHFTTEAGARTAIRMLRPKSASGPTVATGNLFGDDASAS